MTSRQLAVHVPPADERFARRAGAVALLLSLLLIGLRYAVVEVPQGDFAKGDKAFVTYWDPPHTKLETMLDSGDAQAWAALGRDPALSEPNAFYTGAPEFVYRAQRPLPGWMVWAASLGQPGLVGPGLVLVTAIGMGVLVWASALAASAFGRRAQHGVLVAFLPGSVSTVLSLGPDLLAAGLAIAGVVWWYRATTRDRAIAMGLFIAATFSREMLLVVPLAVAAHCLVIGRERLRSVLPLALPLLLMAAWLVALKFRYDAWPSDINRYPRYIKGTVVSNNFAPPLVGVWEARGVMDLMAWATIVIELVALAVGLRRDPRSALVWCAVALFPIAVVGGAWVWALEPQRAFLPLVAFALLGALPFRAGARRRAPAVSRPATA